MVWREVRLVDQVVSEVLSVLAGIPEFGNVLIFIVADAYNQRPLVMDGAIYRFAARRLIAA